MNRGTHGDSSFRLWSIDYSSEKLLLLSSGESMSHRLIAQAKAVSLENSKNTLFIKDKTDHEYIKMREHQA